MLEIRAGANIKKLLNLCEFDAGGNSEFDRYANSRFDADAICSLHN